MGYQSPRQVLDHMYDLMQTNKAFLGLGYIGYADENLLPEYPAVVVSAGSRNRDFAGTHKFAISWDIEFWVHHAKLSLTHKQRTREDMDLTEAIITILDANLTLATPAVPEGNIIFGYVTSEVPGIISRRASAGKNEAVVSTRITWVGEGRQNF